MGKTATNPQTGETVYLDPSGAWKPARTATNPETGETLVFDGDEWVQPKSMSTQSQYNRAAPTQQLGHDTSGALRSAGNTLSFGLTDYAAGAGQMFDDWRDDKPTDKNLVEYRDAEAAKRREWESMNPTSGFLAGMSGAVLNPVNRALGNWAGGGKTLGQMASRGAKAGGAMGGLQAAGESEGTLANRLTQTGTGTAVGAGTGAALPPVVKAGGGALRFLGDKAKNLVYRMAGKSGSVEKTKAARKIVEALQRDELTPAMAEQRIRELGQQAKLIDVGPNTRQAGWVANAVPGKGKKLITDTLVKRQQGVRDYGGNLQGGQQERIKKMIDELIPENSFERKVANEAERKFLGGFYEAAKRGDDLVDTSVMLKELDDEIYISKGSIQLGLKKIRKLLIDPKGHPEIDIRSLHQAKMAIDDFMTGPSRTSIGNVAKGRIRQYQNKLVEAIENSGDAGKLYRTGRLGTAGAWRIDEALDEGAHFMSKGAKGRGPQELDAYLSKLTSEEIEAFKIGSAKALKEAFPKGRGADITKRIFDDHPLEERIKRVFGDAKSFRKYTKMLEGESEMYRTYANTFGGSPTAERQLIIKDSAIDPGRWTQALEDIKHSKYGSALMNLWKGGKEAIFDPEPQSRALAEQLMSRTAPKNVQKAYEALNRNNEFDKRLINILTRTAPPVAGSRASQLQNGR